MINRNSAPPPGARWTVIVPPCASTSPLTMNRPSPAPPRRLDRQNWRKMLGTSSGAIPSPSSRTETATAGAPTARRLPGTPGATGGYGFDRLYHNRHRTSTVPDRVLHQVPEYLVHLVGVQPGLGKLAGDDHLEPLRRLPGGDPAGDYLLHPLGNADELAVDLHPAGLDAGHVQQLGDEPGDPVGVGVDGLQHDPFLVVGEPGPLGQQRRREP